MISDEEIIQIFQPMLGAPEEYLAADPNWSRYLLQVFRGMPWQLEDGVPAGGCARHMDVFFKQKIIAKFCFDCFKVEVQPRTIIELFKVLLVFDKIVLPRDNTRKCMVETRPYVSGAYKGLVYARGLSEGRELYRLVREEVSRDISPDVKVIFKRGCSEHAPAFPRFGPIKPGVPLMDYRDSWRGRELEFDRNHQYKTPEPVFTTPGVFNSNEIYRMQFWMKYAATIGDESYRAISGAPLSPLPDLHRPALPR